MDVLDVDLCLTPHWPSGTINTDRDVYTQSKSVFGDGDFRQMDDELPNDWFSISLSNMGLGVYSYRFYAFPKGEPFGNGTLCGETFEWVLDCLGIHAADATWIVETARFGVFGW